MYYMFVEADRDSGFLVGEDRTSPDFTRAYACNTEAGAKALAEMFLSRNPQVEAVKILFVKSVDQIHRNDIPR